jgi:hypothetical protein
MTVAVLQVASAFTTQTVIQMVILVMPVVTDGMTNALLEYGEMGGSRDGALMLHLLFHQSPTPQERPTSSMQHGKTT